MQQMPFLRDIAYSLLLPVLALYALYTRYKGHPARKGLAGKLGFGASLPPHKKRILLHAVSVGEVNAIKTLVSDLQLQGFDVVICVTTDTGMDRANVLFSDTCDVTRYPFDFSCAVKRFISRIQPSVVALVELEVWPNFIARCKKQNIPVVIINGRLSERSFKRYSIAKPLLKNTFKSIAAIGMQNESYATRVRTLGATNVSVQGTMKWDNAIIADTIDGAKQLSTELCIRSDVPLVVAGSTTPDEHALLLECIPDGVQLLVAPRRPEWFDDAVKILHPCNRRTSEERVETNHFVLDTIGELDKAYALADVVVIGRSFVPMYGSDPTVAVALGKPTIIGPNASDFADIVQVLLDAEGIVQCTKEQLGSTLARLLQRNEQQTSLRLNGKKIIAEYQGATKRYEQLIIENTPHA
jgi:3-deoxy-D-manno-octulosonic-acid transferase